jgi:hypothetical protein
MKERGKPPRIPTRILALIGAVIISSTGMAAYSSITGNKAELAELGDVEMSRELRVETARPATCKFFDQRTGELVATLPTLSQRASCR